MSAVGPLEMRRDILGERFYASRNYNDISETYKVPGNDRAQLDWNLTLRQQRKKGWSKGLGSQSAPNLMTAELQSRPLKTNEHIDGPYHHQTTTDGLPECKKTIGKYQNYAQTNGMVRSLTRVSGSQAHGIDWQLNLRDGQHQKPFYTGESKKEEKDNEKPESWRRYFTRPQKSFDLMAENCNKDNAEYQTSKITPQDRRPDRRTGAISIEMVRDDPINFRRNPGCEGTQAGQWEHLIHDRRYGHKARKQLAHETTLRSQPEDPNGARIEDTRSDGCIVEMLGKKKWTGHTSPDFMSAPYPDGDPKLYHLSRRKIQSEPDEENREKRMNKTKRADADFSYEHTGAMRKKNDDTMPHG